MPYELYALACICYLPDCLEDARRLVVDQRSLTAVVSGYHSAAWATPRCPHIAKLHYQLAQVHLLELRIALEKAKQEPGRK